MTRNNQILHCYAGRIRNIYFPFDIETDTAFSVATEMVAELDITDQDVTRIADMIDGEITSLVPGWKPGPGIEETPRFLNQNLCLNCASNHTSSGSLLEFQSKNPGANNLQLVQCCRHGCASMHGRFEEITYQADESEHHATEGLPNVSSQLDFLHYQEIWGQHESRELSPIGSGQSHSDEEYDKIDQSVDRLKDEKEIKLNNNSRSNAINALQSASGSRSSSSLVSLYHDLSDTYEKDNQQELRWLKAKYQMELRELRDQQLGRASNSSNYGSREHSLENCLMTSLVLNSFEGGNGVLLQSSAVDHQFSLNCRDSVGKSSTLELRRAQNSQLMKSPNAEDMVNAKSFYNGSLLPHSIHRTVSLPVDAVDL